jgi:hypothetical protein
MRQNVEMLHSMLTVLKMLHMLADTLDHNLSSLCRSPLPPCQMNYACVLCTPELDCVSAPLHVFIYSAYATGARTCMRV